MVNLGPAPRRRQRRFHYCAMASAMSVLAPSGLFVLESLLTSSAPSPSWMLSQLMARPEEYAYSWLLSLVILATCGFLLGVKQDLLEVASADELTQLAGRRLFVAKLKEEIQRAHRAQSPLCLLLIDVDNLKAINDRGGGHEVGDSALRAVAKTLRDTCRTTDFEARFGGDEFAMVAPGADARCGMDLAERIRRELRALPGQETSSSRRLTVSIGVADLGDAFEPTPEALCDAADRALYFAKSRGRDCAVVLGAATGPENDCIAEASAE